MQVNIELNNGSILFDCYIYREEMRHGETYLAEKECIEKAFSKTSHQRFKFVNFQNESISGKVPVCNVKTYHFI